MTPERRRIVVPIALATIALAVLLAVRPLPADRIAAGYVLALAAIGLAALTASLSSATSEQSASQFDRMLTRPAEQPSRPPELVRIEREITLGAASAGHLHMRLLPLLREVASTKLGVDLELRPERAKTLLGDDAWTLLRPDRPPPEDRTAQGLPLRRIRALVDILERL
jgi:hypothetical protein